jgi:hypothetical protein
MECGKKAGNFMNKLFVQQDVLINSIIKNFILKTTTSNSFSKEKKKKMLRLLIPYICEGFEHPTV